VDALLAHGAVCHTCAERLRILSADPSPEETAELGKLACASREGQRGLASQLAHTPHRALHDPVRNRLPRLYLWAGAGLAASLLIVAVMSVWWHRANTPERLLAEAYTRARIFDLRMPGAGFAEVTPGTHLRGSATGRESAKLLEARARIEDHLEAAPGDPHWLELEARADVLEEKFDPAIEILDRLLAAGPATPSLLVDDAAAYFQRGAATGSEHDRATALEYLRHADELAPGDPVVLFNEAVVMEDRGQVMNAVETWNRYLRFERDPGWLAEGRRRLQALEQKFNQLKSHQSRMERYLATPQAMRALAADPATLAAIDEELSSTLLPRLLDGEKEESWNHGMGDIVDTLAALGVPDVVATRWQIDSASAVPMMDGFYGGLAKGLTVPQALTAARQTLIRDPRYRHPYYWAAWYASGGGRSDLGALFHAAK
jgi:tetratricopeptide (TPR) repeat protein